MIRRISEFAMLLVLLLPAGKTESRVRSRPSKLLQTYDTRYRATTAKERLQSATRGNTRNRYAPGTRAAYLIATKVGVDKVPVEDLQDKGRQPLYIEKRHIEKGNAR
jgi:hypothetical protein